MLKPVFVNEPITRETGKPDDVMLVRLRAEALDTIAREPDLAAFFTHTILSQKTLEMVIATRLGQRLGHESVTSKTIAQAWLEAAASHISIKEALRADALAVLDRDPATSRLVEPFLYYKGFHALQAYRLAHHLWQAGRRDFALYLQARISEVFQVDVHPAARLGKGIFIDHATGVVIGSTVVMDDNVSILQGVTLGGTGKERGDRHPKIRRGVLIGAGAKVLGNIEIGACARIAAGSVVLNPVPAHKTVAGVPAKIIGESGCAEPARTMDQLLGDMYHDGGLNI